MTAEHKKKILIVGLTTSSLLVSVALWIDLLHPELGTPPLFHYLPGEIWVSRWGWLIVLGLAGYGLVQLRSWVIPPTFLKVAVTIVLLMALGSALVWFLLVLIGLSLSP